MFLTVCFLVMFLGRSCACREADRPPTPPTLIPMSSYCNQDPAVLPFWWLWEMRTLESGVCQHSQHLVLGLEEEMPERSPTLVPATSPRQMVP